MSMDRYKDFTYLDQPTEFGDTSLFSDKYDRIEIHLNTFIRGEHFEGFVGVCRVENGEIISLDGDSYTKHMTVIAYKEFAAPPMVEHGLFLLVSDW